MPFSSKAGREFCWFVPVSNVEVAAGLELCFVFCASLLCTIEAAVGSKWNNVFADRTSIALPEIPQHFAEGGCTQPAGKRVPSILAGTAALPCIQVRSAHWQMVGGECAWQTPQILAFEGPP